MTGAEGIYLRRQIGRNASVGLFWMSMGTPAIVELALESHPDAVVIDAQHGLWERRTIEEAIGTVGTRAPVLVRVAENSALAIGQALDAGAEGVIVPLIETPAEAAAVVFAARFPPQGGRSGGGVRPLGRNFAAYYQAAVERTVVAVMIETAQGVQQAEAIARTPGIDFVFIGTGDLAISLGCFPEIDGRHEEACLKVLAACRKAGVPCGIFTGQAEAALKRRQQGFDIVVVANDIDIVSGGFAEAMKRFSGRSTKVQSGYGQSKESKDMSAALLTQLVSVISSGQIRMVDLTQTLRPSTPVIQLPPPFAQSDPFSTTEISRYDERGPAWYWNNIACGEHTGTHLDAPCHWVTGQHNANGYTDTIPIDRFIAPAVVIDCSKEAAADEKFLLEPAGIEAWEARHGRIPDGSWVLMRTDWSKREDPSAFLNMKEDGPHVPGPSAAAVKFLVEQRNVNGWGVEAVGTDAGQAFAFEPAFPAHHLMHGANKLGLASLCNLDKLPPTGAVLITAPLKIEKGSGSPLRVLALVPA